MMPTQLDGLLVLVAVVLIMGIAIGLLIGLAIGRHYTLDVLKRVQGNMPYVGQVPPRAPPPITHHPSRITARSAP